MSDSSTLRIDTSHNPTEQATTLLSHTSIHTLTLPFYFTHETPSADDHSEWMYNKDWIIKVSCEKGKQGDKG